MKYIMALDQGTTSSRCIIFDHSGAMLASAQKEFAQHYPKPGWVEHDAAEIWETTLEVARGAMAKAGLSAADIAAIGITNQRETTVVWDKETGAPVCPAIVWQCRRTRPWRTRWQPRWAEKIRQRTGLVPDAYFSGKAALDTGQDPRRARGAEEGRLLFGTIDSWLIWNLTGGRARDGRDKRLAHDALRHPAAALGPRAAGALQHT
ncbi:MAG: FGGY family carbohydrate kinase [Oscillospiraceae bacterium]